MTAAVKVETGKSAWEISQLADADLEFPEYTKSDMNKEVNLAVSAVVAKMQKQRADAEAGLRIELAKAASENAKLKGAYQTLQTEFTSFKQIHSKVAEKVSYIQQFSKTHLAIQQKQTSQIRALERQNSKLSVHSQRLEVEVKALKECIFVTFERDLRDRLDEIVDKYTLNVQSLTRDVVVLRKESTLLKESHKKTLEQIQQVQQRLDPLVKSNMQSSLERVIVV